jgi:hypothetical protein
MRVRFRHATAALLLCSCTAGGGDSSDSASPPGRLPNHQHGWHACEDGPWTSVEVGFAVACGVHVGGCIECWGAEGYGGWPDVIYDEPDLVALELSMDPRAWDHDEQTYPPLVCARTASEDVDCWSNAYRPEQHFSLQGASHAVVGRDFLAVLYEAGGLHVYEWHGDSFDVDAVAAPLCAGRDWICGRTGGNVACWEPGATLSEVIVGPSDDWVQFSCDKDDFIGERPDGSVVFVELRYGGGGDLAPPKSGWRQVRGAGTDVLYIDSEGYIYETGAQVDHQTLLVLPEPVSTYDIGGGGVCGVTLDGMMICEPDFRDVYPPPGRYAVRW